MSSDVMENLPEYKSTPNDYYELVAYLDYNAQPMDTWLCISLLLSYDCTHKELRNYVQAYCRALFELLFC
jgi:hypothetical protein